MDQQIIQHYGNRVRVRVCGLCYQDDNLLLVNHKSLKKGGFWAPPGGGVEFGESMHQALIREFKEETGLQVKPGRFLFGCEFIQKPLHAVELFFETEYSGTLAKGSDPELQVIDDVQFLSPDQIQRIPLTNLHGIFGICRTPQELMNLSGLYRI